jgi:signal transduction histidine kinase
MDLKRVLGALVEGVLRPQVHLVLPAELVDVDHELCQVLLRCVQETVTNAIKHSAANNLWIEIRRENDGLILEAHDDGHGAPVVCPGLGLRGMRDRLAARGGQLDFEGAGGAGFRLRALVR